MKYLSHYNKTWFDWVDELKNFKKKYGHCFVPETSNEYGSLGTWCRKQRAADPTPQQKKELNTIGFVWELNAKDGFTNTMGKVSQRQKAAWLELVGQKASNEKRLPIFNHKDFGTYLKAIYLDTYKEVIFKSVQNKRPRNSYRRFAALLGFKSPPYARDLTNGGKRMSTLTALDVAARLKLNEKETEYFYTLVALSHAETPKHRRFFNAQLKRIIRRK